MVVCKCKKATKLYCFVHKVPVCGECICFPEHQSCIVRTYSDWVIDGDYDWPSSCSICHIVFEDGVVTTRLGCLHVVHTHCLVSHLQSFPPHTAPAGYICPACSSPVWPPKSIKDSGSALHAKLKEAISQSEFSKNLLGNDLSAGKSHEPRTTPPAFASGPLVTMDATSLQGNASANLVSATIKETNASGDSSLPGTRSGTSTSFSSDIVEIDGAVSVGLQPALTPDPQFTKSPNTAGPGATTRKGSYRSDKYSPTIYTYEDDDDDASKRKYTRRGDRAYFLHSQRFLKNVPRLPQITRTSIMVSFYFKAVNIFANVDLKPETECKRIEDGGMQNGDHMCSGFHRKFLRVLLPFWSPALPTLPITTPRKEDRDVSATDELIEGHSRRRRSTVDPRKILLFIAILSCMATMMLLYYRLSQSSTNEDLPDLEQQ